ncbi:hypothetical protein CsSME_00011221 [Camellia sinensis var. sinensis]
MKPSEEIHYPRYWLILERVQNHKPRDQFELGLERVRIYEPRDPKRLASNGFRRNLEVTPLMGPRTLVGSERFRIYAPEPWA